MGSVPIARWKELGRLLAMRRAQIDAQYRLRTAFADAVQVHPAILRDIENAARVNYRPATVSAVEVAYRLRPGAIQRFIDGDTDSLEIAAVPAAVAVVAARAGAARDAGTPPAEEAPMDAARQAVEVLKRQAVARGQTLGEVLLARGLATREELTISDSFIDDGFVREIDASNLPDDVKNEAIKAYARARRERFREEGFE